MDDATGKYLPIVCNGAAIGAHKLLLQCFITAWSDAMRIWRHRHSQKEGVQCRQCRQCRAIAQIGWNSCKRATSPNLDPTKESSSAEHAGHFCLVLRLVKTQFKFRSSMYRPVVVLGRVVRCGHFSPPLAMVVFPRRAPLNGEAGGAVLGLLW
jgi:hypothetical protein